MPVRFVPDPQPAAQATIPPPPPGYTLDTPPARSRVNFVPDEVPPPPPGFTLDAPPAPTQAIRAPASLPTTGLVTPGNIDPFNRPRVPNPDGTYSTLRTITIEDNGRTVLLPTVIGGRAVSNQEAVQHYRQTGQHLGIFASEADSEAYDRALHDAIEPGSYDRRTRTPPAAPTIRDQIAQFSATGAFPPDTGTVPPPPAGFTLNLPPTNPVQQAPGDIAGAIGRWASSSDVGRLASSLPPLASTAANLPGIAQVGQAGRATATALGNAPGIAQVGQAARWLWGNRGAPAEAVENVVTGGVGYEQRFREQGADPVGAKVLGALFKGVLDPTNLLAFPGAIARTLGTASNVARTAGTLIRTTGAAEPVAQATTLAARLMTEGRFTGPVIQRTADLALSAIQRTAPLFNKFYGTPPQLRQIAQTYNGDIRTALGASLTRQQEILEAVPAYADRVILSRALRGVVPESDIPQRLQSAYQDVVRAARDATTQRAVDAGVLQTATENYMRRFYTPEAYARIRSGTVGSAIAGVDVGESPATQAARGMPLAQREYEAERFQQALPEEGRRGVYGRQVEPTRGMRGLTSGFQKGRVLTDEQATALGAIEDPAIAIPGHEVEVGHAAANKALYDRIVGLGQDWVRPYGPDLPRGWVQMQQLVGVGPAQRYGWSGLMVHPQVAGVISGLTGAQQYGLDRTLAVLGTVNNTFKRFIFLNPIVHGANMARAAYLSQGWSILNPRYWRDALDMAADAHEMGPITQARLAAGGSIPGGSVGRQIGNTIDEIFLHSPAQGSMVNAGLLKRVAAAASVQKAPGILKGPAFVKEFNDQVLWNIMDAGGRNYTFRHALGELERLAPNVAVEDRARAAARYADLVWNDYSTSGYGTVEKALNSLIFVYPWNRGRARLFSALARSYLPSSAADVGLYRQMAGRWAMMNLVLPHIYRAWTDKQSAGFEAAQMPLMNPLTGQAITDDRGRPIYIKPTGWYQDAVEMFSSPGSLVKFAWARTSPGLKLAYQFGRAVDDAVREGRDPFKAAVGSVVPALSTVYPAGLGQALRPGMPMIARILPSLGVPVTGPPPSENPRMQMQTAIDQGEYFTAGQLARQAGLPFYKTMADLSPTARRQFRRGYFGSGGIPGMPTLPRLPSLPRLP